jgi:hypothetical protein
MLHLRITQLAIHENYLGDIIMHTTTRAGRTNSKVLFKDVILSEAKNPPKFLRRFSQGDSSLRSE